jgi:hypothetical protein
MVVIPVVTDDAPGNADILPVVPLAHYKEDRLAAGVIPAAVSSLFKSSDTAGILHDKRRVIVCMASTSCVLLQPRVFESRCYTCSKRASWQDCVSLKNNQPATMGPVLAPGYKRTHWVK